MDKKGIFFYFFFHLRVKQPLKAPTSDDAKVTDAAEAKSEAEAKAKASKSRERSRSRAVSSGQTTTMQVMCPVVSGWIDPKHNGMVLV